jgi:hypothetical protein
VFGPVRGEMRRGACRSKEALKDIACRENTEDAKGPCGHAADSGEGKDAGEGHNEERAYKSFLQNTGRVWPRRRGRLTQVTEESRIFSWVSWEMS